MMFANAELPIRVGHTRQPFFSAEEPTEMCGIVGFVAERNSVPILMEGLRRLEYRGYDSAGLAVLDGGRVARLRTVGKVKMLQDALGAAPIGGPRGLSPTP